MNQLLPFITDELLNKYTKEVLDKAHTAEADAEAKLYSNVIDPFSAVFAATLHDMTLEEWLVQEKSRQIQKTLENALGDFHQKVLGSMPGWENAGKGGSYDIKNETKKIIAEIKNKHNTMNSSSAEAVYQKLAGHLRFSEKDFTAYLVFIIPKPSARYDKEWSPNQRTMTLRDDIRKIDGASFYDLASGNENALKMLYDVLPSVISNIMGTSEPKVKATSAFDQLFKRAYK
ncbi:MAG: Eco47II family restriction endonuclease [Candidatus Saccharibacteria bacterium]